MRKSLQKMKGIAVSPVASAVKPKYVNYDSRNNREGL